MTQPADPQEPVLRWILGRYLAAALPARIADEGARISLVLLALHAKGSAALGGAMIAALLVPHVVAAPLVGVLVDRARRPRMGSRLGGPAFRRQPPVDRTAAGSSPALAGVSLAAAWRLLRPGDHRWPDQSAARPGRRAGHAARVRIRFDVLQHRRHGRSGAGWPHPAAAVNAVAAQCLLAASAAVAIAALPIRTRPQPGDRSRPSLLSGAREILHRPTLRVITFSSTLGQLGPGALPVVAAVLAASLNKPTSSGLLLAAVAAGAFIGSLLCIRYPIAPDRSPIVVTVSMIGIGTPIALAAAFPSIWPTVLLFSLSGIFIGPFGAALFTARTHYSAEAVRTQVFTIGAGTKVTASAIGAASIGFLSGIPTGAQLLLVAGSPLLAGILGTLALKFRTHTNQNYESPPTRHEISASQH